MRLCTKNKQKDTKNTNLKTHVKYNVFAMTNLKTHAPVDKKQAKEHGKQQNVLKPMRLCTKNKQKDTENT